MNIELTEQEKNLLLELIENEEETAIQGIDHADSRAFKNTLRSRFKILETLKDKISTDKQDKLKTG